MRVYLLAVALTACATHPPVKPSQQAGGPRGLRASEHLDVAAQQQEVALQESTFPDMRNNGINTGVPLAQPWYRSWGAGTDHDENAKYHRAKAGAIYAEYTAACGEKPSAEVAVSPFVRFGIGGWPTQSGAIVYLSPEAGTPDTVMAALVCHQAWMMLAPAENMDDCPLDLNGLSFDARGDSDGITVSLTIKDPKKIAELQRRVAHDLELAQKRAPRSVKAPTTAPTPMPATLPTLPKLPTVLPHTPSK